MPLWIRQAGAGGLGEPVTLATDIWGGKRRVVADGAILCGVDSKRATPLGRLP